MPARRPRSWRRRNTIRSPRNTSSTRKPRSSDRRLTSCRGGALFEQAQVDRDLVVDKSARGNCSTSGRAQEMLDGLDEFADRDRLGQIGLAAALANTFFVALHGKGGNRHNRDRLQFGIVLEPFRHFKTRDLR